MTALYKHKGWLKMDAFFISIIFSLVVCTILFLLLSFITLFQKKTKAKWYFLFFFTLLSITCIGLLFFPLKGDEKEDSKQTAYASLTIDEVPGNVPLNQANLRISGTVKNANQLIINNLPVTIKSDQTFSTDLPLREGKNRVKLIASHTENDSIKEHSQIFTITRSNPTAQLLLESKTYTQSDTHTISGTAQLGARVTVYKDGYEVGQTQANSIKGWFNLKVNTASIGDHTFTVEVTKENYKSTQQQIVVTRQLNKQEQMAINKTTAQTLHYKQLNKNPERFKGKYVKFQGQIVQISESNNRTDIRLSVTKTDKIWNYEDAIWIEYNGYTPFLKGDIITVYGVIHGEHTNTSAAGWNITLPAMIADIIE